LHDGVYSEAIVIQFSREFISPFLEPKESTLIKNMIGISGRGISFEANEALLSKIIELTETNGVDRILKLISILDVLSKKLQPLFKLASYNKVVPVLENILFEVIDNALYATASNMETELRVKISDLEKAETVSFCIED
jgi:hypothetical protein